MPRKKAPQLVPDKIALLDAKVQPGDIVDGGLKVAAVVATIVAAKMVLDAVLDDKLMSWAAERASGNARRIQTAVDSIMHIHKGLPTELKGFAEGLNANTSSILQTAAGELGLLGGLWGTIVYWPVVGANVVALAPGPLGVLVVLFLAKPSAVNDQYQQLHDEINAQRAIVDGIGRSMILDQRALDAVNAQLPVLEAQLAQLNGRLAMANYEPAELTMLRAPIEAQIAAAKNDAHRLVMAIQGQQEAAARAQAIIDKDSKAIATQQQAQVAACEYVRWCFAIIAGVLISTTMLYAGDSIIDLVGDVLGNMFKLPIVMG